MLPKDTQVISFDVGFTLIYPDPPVGKTYANIAARFGYNLDADDVHARFKETWIHMNRLNRQNKAGNAQADEQRSYRWWREIFSQSVGDIIAPADLNPMFDLCYHEYAKGKYWQLYPEVEEILDTLRSKGFRLVVMSNWDLRLDQTLKELKLDRFFEKIYISTRIGYAKPDPAAFRHILEDLNIPANALLHIGDTLQEDIIAAQEAGIQSILLDRRGKYAAASLPANLPRISSLWELT